MWVSILMSVLSSELTNVTLDGIAMSKSNGADSKAMSIIKEVL